MESLRDKDIKQRKVLNADTLFSLIRSSFENFKDHRSEKAQIGYFCTTPRKVILRSDKNIN